MRLSERVIPLSSPDISDLERTAVMDVLKTRHLSLGPLVSQFEEKLAQYLGVRHVVAVNNGTSGLHLCVKALNIGEGDEVITTPFSFVASANCLLYERAVPVFVDIHHRTFNLDVNQLETKITNRTKAILPVHVFGLPCDMDAVRKVAENHGLWVIEDACEAIGATYQTRKVGTLGDCGVFAFYPNKQMTTAEGGAIATDNEEVAAICRSLRNQGRGQGQAWLVHERLGFNYRLSDIHCALGLAQLQRIEELLRKRERVARLYQTLLTDIPGLTLPLSSIDTGRSWFVYVVVLDEQFTRQQRDQILTGLTRRGIGCSNYFPPIHLQLFYRTRFGYKPGDYPIAEWVSDRTIALPFYGDLCEDDVYYVVEGLREELSGISRP